MKYPALLFTSLLLASCATDEEDSIPVDKTGDMIPTKLVGRIASVPSDRRFVLIQSYGDWKVSSGTILTTRGGDERSANLLVTGEVMGQYAAADIQSGEVSKGDAVYSRDYTKSQNQNTAPAPTPPGKGFGEVPIGPVSP